MFAGSIARAGPHGKENQMKLTCEALRKWLEKMPDDAEVRFYLAEDEVAAERELQMKECQPIGRHAYRIDLTEY
jgi:CRISPR/Cas system-associated protein Cas7 (RAMP superfamily)